MHGFGGMPTRFHNHAQNDNRLCAYAWSFPNGTDIHYVTVRELPPAKPSQMTAHRYSE
jgi:hypothetical protein